MVSQLAMIPIPYTREISDNPACVPTTSATETAAPQADSAFSAQFQANINSIAYSQKIQLYEY